MIPQSFVDKKTGTANKGDILIAMMMGVEVGLNPIQSLQNITVINGRPCVWGDAMLGLCQKHPKFRGIRETFDDSTMTATCTISRDGNEHTQTFSKADAELAKLLPAANDYTPWKKYPKRMLAMRARGFALRNQFADALLGLVSAEEAEDMPQNEYEMMDVTPQKTEPEKIETKESELKYYDQTDFDNNMPKYEDYLKTGKPMNSLIAKMESKGLKITEKQMQILEGIQA
jgi:hypothetical protein